MRIADVEMTGKWEAELAVSNEVKQVADGFTPVVSKAIPVKSPAELLRLRQTFQAQGFRLRVS